MQLGADSDMADSGVVTERSANVLLSSGLLSIQRGHQCLLFEQWFDCVPWLACVRHRDGESGGCVVWVQVFVSLNREAEWLPAPLQSCICRLCALLPANSNISKEQTCSWLGIIKCCNIRRTRTIRLPNALLLASISSQRLLCMCSFANMAERRRILKIESSCSLKYLQHHILYTTSNIL